MIYVFRISVCYVMQCKAAYPHPKTDSGEKSCLLLYIYSSVLVAAAIHVGVMHIAAGYRVSK